MKTPKLSKLALRLEGQKMFEMLARAQDMEQSGKRVIHFEIGDPDFPTPPNVIEACHRALLDGNTHYCKSSGLDEFKEASTLMTKRSRGFKPTIGQILVTPGANAQIYYALACAVNPGEEVITANPSFVSYQSIIKMLGIRSVEVALSEENDFRMDPDKVEAAITPRTKMILINSPHNPTGSVLKMDDIQRLYQIAEKYDLYLLSDEVYGRITFDDNETEFCSPSSFDACKERTILVHSFSKSYAMTGWRIGAITAPEFLVTKMALLLETTTSCVSPFIQKASIEAMINDQCEIKSMVTELRKRRDTIVKLLNDLPQVTCRLPRGAFYAFPNIRSTGMSSYEFSDRLLKEYAVASCPGTYFGSHGEGYVRLCFATQELNILEGMTRVREFLKNNQKKN